VVPLNGQPPPPLPCRLVADEGGALLTWSNTITTKQDNEEESVCERERGLLLCSNTITTAMIERERGGGGIYLLRSNTITTKQDDVKIVCAGGHRSTSQPPTGGAYNCCMPSPESDKGSYAEHISLLAECAGRLENK
jgi:hypothetical protein